MATEPETQPQPFTDHAARLPLLCAIARVAEGATVVRPPCGMRKRSRDRGASSAAAAAASALRAVLRDTRNFSVLGGRAGAPRSLGSVHAAAVIRFLGGTLSSTRLGSNRRVLSGRPKYGGDADTQMYAMAISADGVYVIVSAHNRLFLFERATGKFVCQKMCDTLRRVSDYSPRYFETPGEIAVASDGWIYVALPVRKCVAVFTSDVTFQGTINMPRQHPIATCVNDDFLVVGCSRAYGDEARNSVFIYRRCDHKRVRSLGRTHNVWVRALCFLADQRTFAILDASKVQVFMFSLSGVCLRVINISHSFIPDAIACSGFGELCVFNHGDVGSTSFHVFSEYGELLQTVEHSGFKPLFGAVHNGTLYVCGKGDGGDDAAAPLPWILCEYK